MAISIDDVYQGKTIRAADLKNKQVKLTITDVNVETYDEGKKLVLSFKGTEKTMVLNKTNAERIAEWHGRNPDDWTGKQITIYPDRTEYGGKLVDCIRVMLPIRDPSLAHAQAPHTEANPPPADKPTSEIIGDEIPF
jgi:hypothetical protein